MLANAGGYEFLSMKKKQAAKEAITMRQQRRQLELDIAQEISDVLGRRQTGRSLTAGTRGVQGKGSALAGPKAKMLLAAAANAQGGS